MQKKEPYSQRKKILLYFLTAALVSVLILLPGEVLVRLFLAPQALPAPPPPGMVDPYKTNPYVVRMRPWLFFHLPGSSYTQSRSYLIAPSLFDVQWEMSAAYLDYIALALHQRQVELLITNLSIIGLGPGLPEPHSEHARRLDQRVSEWSRQKALPFFSLLPPVGKAWDERPTSDIVIKDDGHPTPKTHKLIADELFPWVLNRLANIQDR